MIPIAKTVFDEDDFAAITKPLESGWVTQGKYVAEFESLFADLIHIENAVAVTSCTTALHTITSAFGLKEKDDEVLVPAFTWIATANCIEYTGAKPVFVDIDLDTFNISHSGLLEKISTNTKAIIPAHLFGLACNMDELMSFARENHLLVIEDAACAFDSWYKDKHAGTFGDAGAFSFHPRKAITTGEGGMVVSSNDKFALKCKSLRNHGMEIFDCDKEYKKYPFLLGDYDQLGYNYRMTDIQAALGIAQLRKAEMLMKARRKIANYYLDELKNLEWLKLPFINEDYKHGFQSFVCLFAPQEPSLKNVDGICEHRNRLMLRLQEEGIMTRPGTHAPAHSKYYSEKYGIKPSDYPNAYIAEKLSLALPLYSAMTMDEACRVVKKLISVFNDFN